VDIIREDNPSGHYLSGLGVECQCATVIKTVISDPDTELALDLTEENSRRMRELLKSRADNRSSPETLPEGECGSDINWGHLCVSPMKTAI
jgi:hypothetical protein